MGPGVNSERQSACMLSLDSWATGALKSIASFTILLTREWSKVAGEKSGRRLAILSA